MSTDQVREEGLEGHIPSSKEDALQEDSSNSSATLQIEEREAGAQDDEKQYPEGLKLGLIILALCLAVFLLALDNSIITTAIPKITDEFHSLDDVGWYGSSYLLTTAALQLLFGKFYTNWNIKWVFLTSIAIFEIGSVICGAAPTSTALIIGRAIAGIGSAGIFSGALLILGYSTPLVKRPTYIGLVGGMYGIASIAGPLLGGVFTDKVTWRLCFYINLPVGAITVVVILFFFKSPKQELPHHDSIHDLIMSFDPVGTALFLPAIIALLLALQWGGTKYSWGSGPVVGLLLVFGFLILAFCYVQYKQKDNATVPFRIISNRSIWTGCWYGFCAGATFFLMMYYVPLWFQAVQGTSAVGSGVHNLPMLITTILTSIFAGGMVTKVGYYTPFMIVATVLMSIGAGMISTWEVHTSSTAWIGYQILFSLGYGMGSRQPLVAVQAALDTKDVPIGTSAVMLLQTLGGAVFVSIAQSVFSNELAQDIRERLPSLNPAIVLNAGATNLRNTLSKDLLPGVILAYNKALTKTFLVAACMAALSIVGSLFMPWKSVKTEQKPAENQDDLEANQEKAVEIQEKPEHKD